MSDECGHDGEMAVTGKPIGDPHCQYCGYNGMAQAAELARVKEERDEYKKLVGERGGELMKAIAEKGLMYERNALKQQLAQLQGQLWEALAALGYPVPGETPPPRYHCGFCAATQAQAGGGEERAEPARQDEN